MVSVLTAAKPVREVVGFLMIPRDAGIRRRRIQMLGPTLATRTMYGSRL